MARSDPARSDYCATRHLLRNLDNVPQLRRNPLVREIFARTAVANAVVEIHQRIDSAMAAIASPRGVAILVRADIKRHDPETIARDLGLSLRQYHRERRRAHELFLQAYRRAHPRQITSIDEDFAARVLRRASGLADSGETGSARAILEDALRSGDRVRAEALVRLANLENWSHRFDRARDLLRAAERAPKTHSVADAANATASAIRMFAEGPEVLEHAEIGGERTAVACADAAFFGGDAVRAKKLLSRISFAQASYEAIVDVLVLQAELSNFGSPDSATSEELFAQAIALAQSEGLHGRALYATHQLYGTRWMHSRSLHDRASYRSLVDTIDPSLSPRLRMYLKWSAADLELAIGSPRRALHEAQAAAALSTSAYERLCAQALASAALFRLGRVQEASREAAATAEQARTRYPRIVSLAQRVNAQALFARGSLRGAREAIEESLECAQGHSSAYVLAQASRIRAGIMRARL